MSNRERCVIIGASHAGVNTAFSLRKVGFIGEIVLVDEDPGLPYHRPPLSKTFLSAEDDAQVQALKSADAYEQEDVRLELGVKVVEVRRNERLVQCENDVRFHYDYLVFATGGRPFVPPIEGLSNNEGVFFLRNAGDALEIRTFFRSMLPKKLIIIGGGYIGLEVAASARKMGLEVLVLEREERLLARVASSETSAIIRDLHEDEGVKIELGKSVVSVMSEVEGSDGLKVSCLDGSDYCAAAVVVGVGIRVNGELAAEAGLEVENGIVVDEYLRTNDMAIYAVGDCSSHINTRYGRRLRLESVQNAVDQAKVVAANICGGAQKYESVPWFWSDQYDMKLQIVGLSAGYDSVSVRKDGEKRSVWYFSREELIAVDAMNDGKAYVLGMKTIKEGKRVNRAILVDTAVALHPKTLWV